MRLVCPLCGDMARDEAEYSAHLSGEHGLVDDDGAPRRDTQAVPGEFAAIESDAALPPTPPDHSPASPSWVDTPALNGPASPTHNESSRDRVVPVPVVAAIIVAILVVTGVAMVVVSSHHPTDNASSSLESDRGHGSATNSSTAPSTGQVISARTGTVSLTLPDDWRGADVSTGVEGVGSRVAPDDPSAAAKIQQRLSILPRAVLLFGVRPASQATTSAFADNVNVLSDPTAPPSLTLEEVGPAEAHGIAMFATVTDQGVVDLGARQAYRVVYKSATFSGVAFIVKGAQDTWVLTYSFGSATADIEPAQASAATFNAP